MRELGRTLIFAGIAMALVGWFLMSGAKLPFRLGRLPGDIAWEGKNTSFYFPIMTCIVLSVAFTAVMWIVQHFRK